MVTQTRALDEGTSTGGKRASALAPAQLAAVIVLGVVLWFAAAMTVRFGSQAGFFGPAASVVAFAITIPVCWLSVLLIKKVARLEASQTLAGIAIGTAVATFCDGIGLTWGRDLFYGSDPNMTTFGAAWILWGVGLFLLFAYLADYHQPGVMR